MSSFAKGLNNHTLAELNAAANAARRGGERAKELLGAMMQPYVVSYLRRIGGDYSPEQRDEMTQAAWVGIWDALGRWDPARGVKFSTYAYLFMHGEVQKWLANNSGVIAVPRQAWANAKSLEDIILDETDGEKMPYDLTDDELAAIQFDRDAGNRRRVASAGDLFRARQQAFTVDEAYEPRGAQPAEDDHFDEAHSVDQDALDARLVVGIYLADGDEEAAWSAALEFIDKHDLPIEVAERLMEAAK